MADEFDVIVIGAGPPGENAAGRSADRGFAVAIVEERLAGVVACGTVPLFPPIEGLADAKPWDNRDATAVKELPRRLLVLGGGAIGAELAQAFKRLGTEEVTVVEGADRLLAREEPFAGEEVRASFEAEGITVLTGARMTKAGRDGSDGPVAGTLEDGREITADEILVAVGRRANTNDVGFDTVGLEPGKFLSVDDRLRATDIDGDWLYGVGDIIAGLDVRDIGDRVAIPRVTFTDPQVAGVGLTEGQARERGLNFRVVTYDTGAVSGAYTRGNGIHGTSQMIVDEERRVIVGATFTGPDVQEIVHAATIAIVAEVTLDTLWHAVPSFPTVSEVWLRLLEAYGL